MGDRQREWPPSACVFVCVLCATGCSPGALYIYFEMRCGTGLHCLFVLFILFLFAPSFYIACVSLHGKRSTIIITTCWHGNKEDDEGETVDWVLLLPMNTMS